MLQRVDPLAWQVLGTSVRGATHERRNVPNQDALAWRALPGGALALAVADGHGSARYTRSATGAAFAVEAALDVLGEFPATNRDTAKLTYDVVSRWNSLVNADRRQNPNKVVDPESYGSTILAALVTAEFCVLLQLGDGDILLVSPAGTVTRPWPRDRNFLGNETASLASSDPLGYARSAVIPAAEFDATLILLATDGYSNSFREEAGFLKIGSDLLEIIRRDGMASVDASLEGWLREASHLGSGDDITLGLLYRG